MTIRMCIAAALMLQCLLCLGVNAYAATVAPAKQVTAESVQKAPKKANPLKAIKKIKHPCARKSAVQLNKRAQPYRKSIQANAKKYGVDSELIQSVITIESCYNQKALSGKGAQGLMQLIPATAERFGIDDAFNTQQNVRGGTRYLSWLSKRFEGDLEKVLAGYNAGEGKVDRYDGIPPYRETRHYVHDVLAVYKKLKQHQQQLIQTTAQTKTVQKKTAQQNQKHQTSPAATVQKTVQKKQTWANMTAQQQAQSLQRLAVRKRQLAAQQRQKQQRTANNKPVRAAAKPVMTQQIIIGQTSQPIRPQPAKRQQPQRAAVKKPVHHRNKTGVTVQRASAAMNTAAAGRIKQVYASPFKPGRAGWQANKARAPQLYKK